MNKEVKELPETNIIEFWYLLLGQARKYHAMHEQ